MARGEPSCHCLQIVSEDVLHCELNLARIVRRVSRVGDGGEVARRGCEGSRLPEVRRVRNAERFCAGL